MNDQDTPQTPTTDPRYALMHQVAEAIERLNDNAPAEQKQHFVETLHMLLGAYEPNAHIAIMATIVDRRTGHLQVHGINMSTEEMQLAATLALDCVVSQTTPPANPSEVH